MKSVSRWAAMHLLYSRVIIVLCHVLLVVLAIFLGLWTAAMNIRVVPWIAIGMGNLFFIAYVLYPGFKADRGFFKYSYLRQKALDFALVLSYFLVLVCGVNQFVTSPLAISSESSARASFIVFHHDPGKDANRAGDLNYKTKIKAFKKQLRADLLQLKQSFKSKNDRAGVVIVKILLVLLCLSLALALGLVIAALACNVACSGAGGLAWVILIVGWAATVWLLIVALKAILHRRRSAGSAAVA